ncbi:MAG: DivIVA domain-containing protein [Acidimicrobiales bacterium]|nr:DivIVA domain-containing protein [Acidimicrobiales bacterium]
MSPEPTDRPPIDPDAVAQHAFSKGRKGYDTDEVRAFLVGLASEIRDLQRVHGDTARRLTEVERRAADPRDLDEESVTQLLGEETARVLVDARKAAAEIRSKAEEEAAALRDAANAEAAETRAAAEQYADSVRTLADEGEAKARAEADAYATNLRETTERETTEQRTAADAYATEVRETADREVAEQRETAQREVDELTEKARNVLGERTAEAETAAAAIRTDADAYDTRVRGEADTYSESTRSAADTYRDETRAEADTAKADAEAAAAEVRAEADEAAAANASEAAERYDARIAEAEAEAERIVDEAREKGRGMVQEARGYRERVIADLAERRRSARDELDRIANTRDALAVTLTDVRTQIERSHRSLQDVAIDSKPVSDSGADRRFLEVDESASGLAVGEVEGEADEVDGPEDVEGPEDAGEVEDGADLEDATDDEGDLEDEAPVWSDDEAAADDQGADDGDDEVGSAVASDEPDEVDSVEETDAAPGEVEPDEDELPGDESTGGGEPAESTDEVDGSEAADDADDHGDLDGGATTAEAEPEEPRTAPGISDLFARIRAESEASEAASTVEEPTGDAPSVADTSADVAEDSDAGSTETDSTGQDTAESAEGSEEEAGDRSPDVDLLELRDATTDEIERQLARRLKRVLSDEQNEALHNLRNLKGAPTADAVLPTEEDHLSRFRQAVLEDLRAAERAGASFYSDAPDRAADVTDIADELSGDLVRQVRGRLERSFDGSDDPDDVADGIRTIYREWKTQRIAEAARHFVIAAFSRGVAEAAPDGSSFRWLVDHGGAAAPDCEDNALAGAVQKGQPFPTGDLLPPVHPGCRCLAVPAN